MARIKLLRQRLRWSQKRMAEHLHCSQATIARMELGQAESGPVSLLLDQLTATASGEVEVVSGVLALASHGAAA